jgi:hypothetical protein
MFQSTIKFVRMDWGMSTALCSVLLTKYYAGDQVKKNWMGRVCGTYGREVYAEFWWVDLRERNHLEDLGIDERIILKLIFNKGDGKPLSGLTWLRTGGGGWLL